MDLDWCCTGLLKVSHLCLMWTFLDYSACWRSNLVLVNTPDAAPFVSGQNRVVIFSSIIAKMFNPRKCWTSMAGFRRRTCHESPESSTKELGGPGATKEMEVDESPIKDPEGWLR